MSHSISHALIVFFSPRQSTNSRKCWMEEWREASSQRTNTLEFTREFSKLLVVFHSLVLSYTRCYCNYFCCYVWYICFSVCHETSQPPSSALHLFLLWQHLLWYVYPAISVQLVSWTLPETRGDDWKLFNEQGTHCPARKGRPRWDDSPGWTSCSMVQSPDHE